MYERTNNPATDLRARALAPIADLESRLIYYDITLIPEAPRIAVSTLGPRPSRAACVRRQRCPVERKRQVSRAVENVQRTLSTAYASLVMLSHLSLEPGTRVDETLWRRVMKARVLLEDAHRIMRDDGDTTL